MSSQILAGKMRCFTLFVQFASRIPLQFHPIICQFQIWYRFHSIIFAVLHIIHTSCFMQIVEYPTFLLWYNIFQPLRPCTTMKLPHIFWEIFLFSQYFTMTIAALCGMIGFVRFVISHLFSPSPRPADRLAGTFVLLWRRLSHMNGEIG